MLEEEYDEVIIAPKNTPGLDIKSRKGVMKIGWQVKTRDRRTTRDRKTGSDDEFSHIKLSDADYMKETARLWEVDMVGYAIVLLLDDFVEVFWFSQNAYNKYTKRKNGGRSFNMNPSWRKIYENDKDVQIERRKDLGYFGF